MMEIYTRRRKKNDDLFKEIFFCFLHRRIEFGAPRMEEK
jgi:hypothetical protein